MTLKAKTGVVLALAALSIFAVAQDAGAGNGWGWAKPLNQKAGSLLYTTQRKAKTHYRSNVHRTYTTPLYRYPAVSRRYSVSPAVRYPAVVVPAPSFIQPHTIVRPPVTIYSTPTVIMPRH